MRFASVKETAAKWGLGERRVRGLCQEGRIAGATRSGRDWLIPADAQRPVRNKAKRAGSGAGRCDERLELYLNPTYCAGRPPDAVTEEERLLCHATDLFLKGHFDETMRELDRLIAPCTDDSYLLVAHMMLYLVYSCGSPDAGKAESELAEVDAVLERNPGFCYTKKLVGCVRGERPEPEDVANMPARFRPVFAQSVCYLGAMDNLADRRRTDPACLELLALAIDEDDWPAQALYAHIALALYYRLRHNQALYDFHVAKSLEIALPRKWYAPLANYANMLDWHEVSEIDLEAYREIQGLSGAIMGNYVKSGRFGKALSGVGAMDANEFKVAYMSAKGISVQGVAQTLHMSVYQIRKTLKSAYDRTGAADRESLRALLNSQFRAV